MLYYRIMLFMSVPVLFAYLLFRRMRGLETWAGIAERLGSGAGLAAPGAQIWLHGASLGELTSARPIIDQMLGRNPSLQVIVTANTCSGRDMVQGWDDARICARLAPLDYAICVRRFLATCRPLAMVTLENEIWPVRVIACAQAGIAVLVVGGRMSARSAALWARLPALSRRVMDGISGLWPLDAQNADRFVRLGLPAARIHAQVNLKSGVQMPAPRPDQLAEFSRIWPRSATILAASVHTAEADIILQAFCATYAEQPDLRLILAPRHPHRADAFARMIETRSLSYSRRTRTAEPLINNAVYLADTIGEMSLWYSAAAITVVGGSFVDKGGHTPFEPVQFASVVVHGPDTANHAEAYGALHQADAAHCAQDATDLSKILIELAGSKSHDERTSRATGALDQIRRRQSIPEVFLAAVDALIGNKS
ncbi:MAG: 3-deoxy-D-manno-octulosonic acid transferase [Paracoccaceae bacterium]